MRPPAYCVVSLFIFSFWAMQCAMPNITMAAAKDDGAVYNFATRSTPRGKEAPKKSPPPPETKENKPAPLPEKKMPPKKNEDLKIPQDAAKKNDLSFLEGCWTSETGLFSHPSGEPITAEYCFDKKGKGRRFVRERNGQVCSGAAKARFQGSRLEFDATKANCPKGGQYVPQDVKCTGSETSTQCHGNERGGKGLKWDARFKRK